MAIGKMKKADAKNEIEELRKRIIKIEEYM